MAENRETNTQVPMSTWQPAHSPVERVTEKKAQDKKNKWRPGVQSLPPEKQHKNGKKSFWRQHVCKYSKEADSKDRERTDQTNGENKETGHRGSLGLVLRPMHLRSRAFRARAPPISVPRRWRQARLLRAQSPGKASSRKQ